MTLAAGMACEGAKPVVAIYSTFLQRGYDQLIHDVAIQNLDVLFAIDRGGVVGPDGATHAGSFDLSYLRCIPNMVVMAPADENECRQMLTTGFQHAGPAAVRYPRGTGPGVAVRPALETLPIGKAEVRRRGAGVALLAFGALLCRRRSRSRPNSARPCVNMRFVKPLDRGAAARTGARPTTASSRSRTTSSGRRRQRRAPKCSPAEGIALPMLHSACPIASSTTAAARTCSPRGPRRRRHRKRDPRALRPGAARRPQREVGRLTLPGADTVKPIAIFQHAADVGPGYFAQWLDAQRLPYTLFEVEHDAVPADSRAFSGLCFMGGPMSVNDPLPWIDRELALIRDADARDIPIIGHCLGGQLLAKALGARVTRQPVKEIGWADVAVTERALAAAWLGADVPERIQLFHWHEDAFALPAGARNFMATPSCAHQAYVIERPGCAHLGMQFHCEMTPELVRAWASIRPGTARSISNRRRAAARPCRRRHRWSRISRRARAR